MRFFTKLLEHGMMIMKNFSAILAVASAALSCRLLSPENSTPKDLTSDQGAGAVVVYSEGESVFAAICPLSLDGAAPKNRYTCQDNKTSVPRAKFVKALKYRFPQSEDFENIWLRIASNEQGFVVSSEKLSGVLLAFEASSMGSIVQITTSETHTCALLSNKKVKCWGLNSSGALGYPGNAIIGDNETPSSIGFVDVGEDVEKVIAGDDHTCALLSSKKVKCWGSNAYGSLGTGNTDEIHVPKYGNFVSLTRPAADIAGGSWHSCAARSYDGTSRMQIICWGRNKGRLGYGFSQDVGRNPRANAGDQQTPFEGEIREMAAGGQNTCVLTADKKLKCWGLSPQNALGLNKTIGDDEAPSTIGFVNMGGDVEHISSGPSHACAIMSNSKVKCWGYGGYGQLGYGNSNSIGDDETPASIGYVDVGADVEQISAGGQFHTCAVLSNKKLKCWGVNIDGQLGYGNRNMIGYSNTPASVGFVDVGDDDVERVATGGSHTCVLLSSHNMKCWGKGQYGVLGYGNEADIGADNTPASVETIPVYSVYLDWLRNPAVSHLGN